MYIKTFTDVWNSSPHSHLAIVQVSLPQSELKNMPG